MDILLVIIILIALVGGYLYYKKNNNKITTKYSCVNNVCSEDIDGDFSTIEDCTNSCKPSDSTPKYLCNTNTKKCEVDENGTTTDQQACDNDCKSSTGWTVKIYSVPKYGDAIVMRIYTYDYNKNQTSQNDVGSGNDVTVTVPLNGYMTVIGRIAASRSATLTHKQLSDCNATSVNISAHIRTEFRWFKSKTYTVIEVEPRDAACVVWGPA